MEDTARLALIEMYVNNEEDFENFLTELLQIVNHILHDPHNPKIRKLNSDFLNGFLKCEDFCAYLKYIGFERQTDGYVYPEEQTLSKLKSAQAALEKKITYCFGSEGCTFNVSSLQQPQKICKLTPANVLTTTNSFLLSIQKMFNNVLNYEDEQLQELARLHIPLVQLQLGAIERMREHQKKIKMGEASGEDLSFEMALVSELLGWFKHRFFAWVDRPPCERCGADTRFLAKEKRLIEGEHCLVEEFECTACERGRASFPRHNSPRVLLRTRRGRCGEFANCFALLCRALGYDTRYVYSTTDHVWCEVFDVSSNSWVHADPCEARLGAPLLYACGWAKRLEYVLAFSRDDLQDVTWRYTTDHKEVLSRRALCSEAELLDAILRLRAHRHAQLPPARRRRLAARALRELIDMMVERKPEDCETEGRVSGSAAWRHGRGELGAAPAAGHTFTFEKPGTHEVRYYTSSDRYEVRSAGHVAAELRPWSAGVYASERVHRMVELDWKQAYLARDEGEETGQISWRLACAVNRSFQELSVSAVTALYDTGRVQWTLQFDRHEPEVVNIGNEVTKFKRSFKSVLLQAVLSGGSGGVAWQHAQLFRQPLSDAAGALLVQARLYRDHDIELD